MNRVIRLNEEKYYDFTLNRLRGVYSPIYEDVHLLIYDKAGRVITLYERELWNSAMRRMYTKGGMVMLGRQK